MRQDSLQERVLQEWSGIIQTVNSRAQTATVILTDITTPSNPAEIVELDLRRVHIDDRATLVPGAVFIWKIISRNTGMGARQTASVFTFPRPEPPDQNAKQAIDQAAADLARKLDPGQ